MNSIWPWLDVGHSKAQILKSHLFNHCFKYFEITLNGFKKHLYQLLDEAISYRKQGPDPGPRGPPWTSDHTPSFHDNQPLKVNRRQGQSGNDLDNFSKHHSNNGEYIERAGFQPYHHHYLPPLHEFHHHHHHHENKHKHQHQHKRQHMNTHDDTETYVHVHKHKHKHKHDHFHEHDAVAKHSHDNDHQHKHQNEHIDLPEQDIWRRKYWFIS